MGSGRFDSRAYASYTASNASATREEIFKSRQMHASLDPKNAKLRESRDSADNPESNAIIVALDVTGSMGHLAESMCRKGLGTLFTRILTDKPVSDPHVMFMAVGDVNYDQAPLQVSQFEADLRIVEQLTSIWIEHGGGGNQFESYNLPWYFAAMHTSIDCYEKRDQKGFLFTVGDEEAPEGLTKEHLQKFIDAEVPRDLTNAELLLAVEQKYHVFHVIVEEGSHARANLSKVRNSWTSVLGQNVLSLSDHNKLADLIVETISIVKGRSTHAPKDLVIADATRGLRTTSISTSR